MKYEKKYGISFIVPFYNGNKYIQNIYECVQSISEKLDMPVELIIINDSPEVTVDDPAGTVNYVIKVLKNEVNSGIHYSRIKGLRSAQYEWIQYLDQDDSIISEKYKTQLVRLEDFDWVVGNGANVDSTKEKRFYKNEKEMKLLISENTFLTGRNYIRSPGHCLIRKSAVPDAWMHDVIQCNGADDLFLWMLMFDTKVRIRLNDEVIYLHNQLNGENLSLNNAKMRESCLEVCDKLERNRQYPKAKALKLKDICEFRYAYMSKDKSHISKAKYALFWIRGFGLYVKRIALTF